MDGRTFNCREENVLHQILTTSVVKPSLEEPFIDMNKRRCPGSDRER
jgi:hypothetical protein